MNDYLSRARACRTENQFNRLHIEFENVAPPVEIAAIARGLAAEDAPQASRAWIAAFSDHAPGLVEAPQPFVRRQVTPSVSLYAGPSPAVGKRLLIAFTGKAWRMMLPTAMFLQAIDAKGWDVLMLTRRRSFLDGVMGVSEDFDGLVAWLRRDFVEAGYRSVTTLGASGGGGVAILAALKLRARRGVSISGVANEAVMAAAPRRRALGRWIGRPRLVFVHSAHFEADALAAETMRRAWGGERRAIDLPAGHNLMWPLQKRGRLKAFLGEVM